MKILITGICGFAGHAIAAGLQDSLGATAEIVGIDNLSRAGSWSNREALKRRGIQALHGDIRSVADLDGIGKVDWVIDAAANPSVMAGIDGKASSRQLVEHNLFGTVNLLELCKRHGAGFILISTSRVYNIPALNGLKMAAPEAAFVPIADQDFPTGISPLGLAENASTAAPVSLYGATKVASETLALEYGATFDFPVRINRCGVLAGAGQFGRADQGIFSYWIHAWRSRRPLRYIGFDGQGHQVRDCLHPGDLVRLLTDQLQGASASAPAVVNLGGGVANSMSLRQLSDWCVQRFGEHEVAADNLPRPFDLPWVVMDSSLAAEHWNWRPQVKITAVLEEIAGHAEENPDWLDVAAG